MGLLFVATMLVVTISGVFYMVSTGSKGMMDKAKKALTYGLTAFVIGMGCWLLINIIMTMVGFQNPTGGNWWEFTCDTTQTQGATPSTISTGTNATGNQQAPGDYKPSACADGAVKNAQALQDKTIYDQGKTTGLRGKQDSNGYWHLDCSAFVNKAWQDAGLKSPGNSTSDMKSSYTITQSNRNSAGPGDLLVIPGQHVVMCVDAGCNQVIHSSGTGVNVKVSNGDYYIAQGAGVIRAADYGGSTCKTAMLNVLFAKI
jgi:cell wall-associated NlpC family hydrolase